MSGHPPTPPAAIGQGPIPGLNYGRDDGGLYKAPAARTDATDCIFLHHRLHRDQVRVPCEAIPVCEPHDYQEPDVDHEIGFGRHGIGCGDDMDIGTVAQGDDEWPLGHKLIGGKTPVAVLVIRNCQGLERTDYGGHKGYRRNQMLHDVFADLIPGPRVSHSKARATSKRIVLA